MKIGSASWIKRGSYHDNSLALENHVDFVELLVYAWDKELEELLTSELPSLKELSLFYTVHLPLDTIENCTEAYAFFKKARFPVMSYTLHPLKGWEKFIKNKPDVILVNLIDICVPYKNMCLDLGHLKLSGKEEFLLNHKALKAIKEIHIHGVVGHKDHCILNTPMLRYLTELKTCYPVVRKALENQEILLNFEIFDLKKLLVSLRRIRIHAISRS